MIQPVRIGTRYVRTSNFDALRRDLLSIPLVPERESERLRKRDASLQRGFYDVLCTAQNALAAVHF